MDKLTMAHDWYLKHSEGSSFMYTDVKQAWQYADAMQAEAEKREDKTRPDVLCEVDWSQAPESANVYFKDGDNEPPKWFDRNNKLTGTAPDFGFSGYACEYRPQ